MGKVSVRVSRKGTKIKTVKDMTDMEMRIYHEIDDLVAKLGYDMCDTFLSYSYRDNLTDVSWIRFLDDSSNSESSMLVGIELEMPSVDYRDYLLSKIKEALVLYELSSKDPPYDLSGNGFIISVRRF